MSKEVAKKEKETALTTPMTEVTGIDQENLLIGRLLMAQKTSKIVEDGKAQFGDIYTNVPLKLLSSKGAPIKFIPISSHNTWEKFEMIGKKPKWKGSVAMPPVPPAKGSSFVEHDNHKYIKCINFFVMLQDELGRADALPYHLSFMNTSERAGKQLSTAIFRKCSMGAQFCQQVYTLGTEKKTTNDNTFAVWTVEDAGENKNESHVKQCNFWQTQLAKVTTQIASEETETTTSQPARQKVAEAEAQY